ncbi:MAG: hypothetical protein ACRDRK_15540 [Pseudonocardia sp.]
MTASSSPFTRTALATEPSVPIMRAGSHAALVRTDLGHNSPPVRAGQIDAVIVPTSRGADALAGAAQLAVRLGAVLVALCSKQTSAGEVADRRARTPGCRAIVVDVPPLYRHDLLPTRTDAARFRAASADRSSDLSLKRNIGLLLARLHNWGKVIFLDDDIGSRASGHPVGIPDATLRRLVSALDTHQMAGMTCRQFADNSVVCHGYRLAGFEQDTFISGAALGVNCNDHPIPFFPDVYDEDWFFMSRRVAARDIAHVGDAIQTEYDPFGDPLRARQEEFGDLLAEGLFTLFEDQPGEMDYRRRLDAADGRFWERYIEARRDMIGVTAMSLEMAIVGGTGDPVRLSAALRSIDAAAAQLARLTPELCVDFLDAWADDLVEWEQEMQRVRAVRSTAEAVDVLGLRNWCEARAATAAVPWS